MPLRPRRARRLPRARLRRGASFIEAAIWGSGYEDLGDCGAMDAEGYLAGFAERLGYALTLDQWIAALRSAVTPLSEALALAARIAREARVAVLTNNNLLVAREFDRIFPELRPIFGAHIFVSAEFGARKPDPEAYLRCLSRLGAAPQGRCSSTTARKTSPAPSAPGSSGMFMRSRGPGGGAAARGIAAAEG